MEQTEKNDIGQETFRLFLNPLRPSQSSHKKISTALALLKVNDAFVSEGYHLRLNCCLWTATRAGVYSVPLKNQAPIF